MKTLQEYYELPMLDNNVRDKMHNKLIETILDDKDVSVIAYKAHGVKMAKVIKILSVKG